MSTDEEVQYGVDPDAIQWNDGPYDIRLPVLRRQRDIVAAIIATDDADEAEGLVHQLKGAPTNREQLRAHVRLLPRAARRMCGFGLRWNRPLVTR